MKCVLQFLEYTINDKRVIGAENLIQLGILVDSTYVAHPDLKSHIGGGISFGYVLVHFKSRKQKLNTKFLLRTK